MSRFLRMRKFWVFVFSIITAIALIMVHWYLASVFVFIFTILFGANELVLSQCMRPLRDLSPKRPIRRIDTLIIGEFCSRKALSSRFDLSKSLFFPSPSRSVESSYLVLQHVSSRLDGKQVCIVCSNSNKEASEVLDVPYLSLLTKLERNIKDNPFERRFFLFYHPTAFLKYVIGLFSTPKDSICQNPELVEFCHRKGFQLIFLQK